MLSELSQASTPTGGGQKRYIGPTLNSDRTYLCNEHDINNRKETFQSTETPLYAPKFDELCWAPRDRPLAVRPSALSHARGRTNAPWQIHWPIIRYRLKIKKNYILGLFQILFFLKT